MCILHAKRLKVEKFLTISLRYFPAHSYCIRVMEYALLCYTVMSIFSFSSFVIEQCYERHHIW